MTPFVTFTADKTKALTHVAANHSTNSLWLKLTRLGTITIDEP